MLKQTTIEKQTPSQRKPEVIKLGIDAHKNHYVVVRQIDNDTPDPAQSFTHPELLHWIKKQLLLGNKVYTCYEAGCFGYTLHRQLEANGVTNYVIRPKDWTAEGPRVKTDRKDALKIVQALDSYTRGNKYALSCVRVPRVEEERRRSYSRQRDFFLKQKKRFVLNGVACALNYGYELTGIWYGKVKWPQWCESLPEFLIEMLTPLREAIVMLEEKLHQYSQKLRECAPKRLPRGLGRLTYEQLEREICDWNRFENRKQVGSYTGLCPCEFSSGGKHRQGSINKHGNPRIRTLLVEAMWRMIRYQPNYCRMKKYTELLYGSKKAVSSKKKAIVALARMFIIDWWRIRTGRAKAEELGLEMGEAI